MKIRNLILLTFLGTLLVSCNAQFYQLYKVTPIENSKLKENNLVYEDENCRIFYYLWGEGGDIGFRFFNKTDKNIYINMEESFFIFNGIAHNYYKNRVFISSLNQGASHVIGTTQPITVVNNLNFSQTNKSLLTNSLGVVISSGYSVEVHEEKIVCVPSLTSKSFSEYSINQALYRDCDLYIYPKIKEIKTKSFTRSNSPFVFSNRIVYTVGQTGNSVKVENEFFVSDITNYPQNDFIENKSDEFCDQKSTVQVKFFKNEAPDKFYISYKKGSSNLKH